ncbi:hypothetical protein FRC04_009505 [Tulasnella sp. 424]|nr:hypothetical protein FRC04_009505 [Tulasnella sp. 424]
MTLCGLCNHIPWLNTRERSRNPVIQHSVVEIGKEAKAPAPDTAANNPAPDRQPFKSVEGGDQTPHNASITQLVRNTEEPGLRSTHASTPEVTAAGLDDTLHASLGSELHNELRRGHRHSLGSWGEGLPCLADAIPAKTERGSAPKEQGETEIESENQVREVLSESTSRTESLSIADTCSLAPSKPQDRIEVGLTTREGQELPPNEVPLHPPTSEAVPVHPKGSDLDLPVEYEGNSATGQDGLVECSSEASTGAGSIRLADADELQGELIREPRPTFGWLVDLYKGRWVSPDGQTHDVAIKVLRPLAFGGDEGANEKRGASLLRQSKAWASVRHRNVLAFLGCRLGKEPCIVLPWCRNGNITMYLAQHPEMQRIDKIVLLHQASLGLRHLHTLFPTISHGNICPENILINDPGEAVISDFNLSKVVEEESTGISTSGAQWSKTSGYTAPELLMSDSELLAPLPVDIYSFGGTTLAVMSGLLPHHRIFGRGSRGRFFLAIMGGAVPVPSDHPNLPDTDPLWELMNMCWTFDPKERPSINEVVGMLGRQAKEDVQSIISFSPSPSVNIANAVDGETGLSDTELDVVTELPGELIHETDPPHEKTVHGGFADVVKGRWTRPDGQTITVAIKYLRTVAMQTSHGNQEAVARMNKRVDREVLIWRGLHSPYILELYGFRSGEQPCLISPWCNNGTLMDYLEAHPLLVVVDKLELLVQAGKGLQYLHEHSPPISHGDIKPSNILIDDSNCARLCDFGLSQFLEQLNPELQTSFVGQGSKGYQAPELIRDGVQDLPSDVYAFGCVVLEVMSGKPPFYKLKAGKAFLVISAGSSPEPSAHPKLPPSDPIWDILRKCWAAPLVRPTIREVVRMV